MGFQQLGNPSLNGIKKTCKRPTGETVIVEIWSLRLIEGT